MKRLFTLAFAALTTLASAQWAPATLNGLTYYVDGSHIAIPLQVHGDSTQYLAVYQFSEGIHVFQPADQGRYLELWITSNAIYQNFATGWAKLDCQIAPLKQRKDASYKNYLANLNQYWAAYYKTQYLVDDRLFNACRASF